MLPTTLLWAWASLHALAGTTGRCPPPGYDRATLAGLAAREFRLDDRDARQALALALVPCLAHADPTLRDGVAFEALSTWMRADQLDVKTRLALVHTLLPRLAAGVNDRKGFSQPFAVLVLSEVARTDRLAPFLDAAEREALLRAGAAYLERLGDYRGFDEREGWRHGVAHTADLLLQLALNPALDRVQLDRILAAVAAKVAPSGKHFYIYGEGSRLARPVLAVAGRGLHEPAEWSAWFHRLAEPGELGQWSRAFQSQAGLARRHNVLAFLHAVHVGASESDRETRRRILPAVTEALEIVP